MTLKFTGVVAMAEDRAVGRAQIYAHLQPMIQNLHVSEAAGYYTADTRFPNLAHFFRRSTPQEQCDGFRSALYEK